MQLGSDYLEVRYEDLVSKPREVLAGLSAFVDQDLDYDVIQRAGIGSVSRPNSSFRDENTGDSFNPVGRWKKLYSPEEAAMFQRLVGKTLWDLGYESSVEAEREALDLKSSLFRAQYEAFFAGKFHLKTKTPLGRYLVTRDLSRM